MKLYVFKIQHKWAFATCLIYFESVEKKIGVKLYECRVRKFIFNRTKK